MTEQVKQKLSEIKSRLDNIRNAIDCIRSDEEDYMYNIPENIQESDRYYAAEEAVDNLEAAFDSVEYAMDEIDELAEDDGNE